MGQSWSKAGVVPSHERHGNPDPLFGKRRRSSEPDEVLIETKKPKTDSLISTDSKKEQPGTSLPDEITLTSSGITLDQLPTEILLQIFKIIPDLRTLDSLVLSCKRFQQVFAGDEDAVLTSVLYNDIGSDVMIDYLEIDQLYKGFPVKEDGNDTGEKRASILAAIDSRKQRNIPRVLPHASVAYIAIQAGLVRKTLDSLLADVLFAAVPDKKAPGLIKAFYKDLVDQHLSKHRQHQSFDKQICKKPLDSDERRRFLRGLHRIHICRMISTGGWTYRPGPSTASIRGKLEIQMNSETRPSPESQIATDPKTDQFPGNDPTEDVFARALCLFLGSISPWQKEEIVACAKLLVRGYAYNARRAGLTSMYGMPDDFYGMVLNHFSHFLATQDSTFAAGMLNTRASDATLRSVRYFFQELKADFLILRTVTPSLKRYLRNVSLPDDVPWVEDYWIPNIGHDPLQTPYDGMFEHASPLYCSLVKTVTRWPTGKEPLDTLRFIDGCWAMWSDAERLKAWPQWKCLKDDLHRSREIREPYHSFRYLAWNRGH